MHIAGQRDAILHLHSCLRIVTTQFQAVFARYVASMTDTPSLHEPGASDSGKPVSRPGKRALEEGDAAPPGGKPKLLTSKILGTAHLHKPRIGPQYQAFVPPFQAPPTRPPAGLQQGHENGTGGRELR